MQGPPKTKELQQQISRGTCKRGCSPPKKLPHNRSLLWENHFDDRSDPKADAPISMMLDIDLLLQKKTFQEIRTIAENGPVYSMPGVTFMSALSDKNGNVLRIIPGQGYKYYERPEYVILTNFSPFKGDSEKHPWMGMDRYQTSEELLSKATENFDVKECFDILKACSQVVCPTVVSMVFDVNEMKVYWCENRQWDKIESKKFSNRK